MIMKAKSSRLKPVEQLAENHARNATEAMVTARNEYQGQKQKLSDLQRYRNDYLEQLQHKARTGINAGHLQHYQQFIGQLDKAIEQQEILVYRSQQILDEKQLHWQNKNSHKKALNKAVEKLQQQEEKQENRKEQLELDEHNIQVHIRK
jgi:flagellar FliJ protein